jgi:outer membrane receptor protein involved in Fe transport
MIRSLLLRALQAVSPFPFSEKLRIGVSLLLCLSAITLSAQSRMVDIKGSVIDLKTGEPVSYASVIVKTAEKYIAGGVTDDKGAYLFKNVPEGRYTLQVSFVGYETDLSAIDLFSSKNTLPPVKLKTLDRAMGEVTVLANASDQKTNIEKTTIHTSRSINAATGSVLDLLKTSSSISVDGNGDVSIRGNHHILLLMDGIPTTLDALSTVPAALSKAIDIVTSPGVKYDAEGTGGIINISTKSTAPAGYSGMASVNYGWSNRFNGTVGFNYVAAKWNVSVNYNGKDEKTKNDSELHQLFHATSNTVTQHISASPKISNQVFGIQAQYKADKKNSYTMGGKVMFPHQTNFQDLTSIENGTTVYRKNEVTFNRNIYEGFVGYKHFFEPKKKELSISSSISQTRGDRPANYYENGELVQKSSGGGRPFNATLQADYLYVVSANSQLEAGAKQTVRDNDFKYHSWEFNALTHEWEYADFFSSDLKHREWISAAYVQYTSKIGKSFDYQIGGRFEYGLSTLDSKKESIDHYTSKKPFFAPYLQANYRLSGKSALAFSATHRITRPTYPQLNPYVSRIDSRVYETGNKGLQPEEVNKLDFGYDYSGSVFTFHSDLYLNVTDDYIAQIASLYDTDALMLTYINGLSDVKTGLDLSAKVQRWKAVGFSLHSNVFYGNNRSEYNDMEYQNNGWMYLGNVASVVTPYKGAELEMQYFYNSRQLFPQFTANSVHYMNIGFKQSLAKNRLSLNVLLTDVFNTQRWDIHADNTIYKLKNSSKTDTRVLWVGLTYRLNAFKPQKANGATEENRAVIQLGQ